MSLGSGISSNLNNRFEALCAEGVLEGEGFGLKFEAGQWKIKRDGIDTEFQVFSIKVPRGADKVEYLHLLAEEFKDDDEFIEKLLHTAAKTVEAFAVAQQWLGSSVATGTIKFGFTGKVQSSDFEATRIASNIGGLQKEAKAEDKGDAEERIRYCANNIFGRFYVRKEPTAPPGSGEDMADDETVVSEPIHSFSRRDSDDLEGKHIPRPRSPGLNLNSTHTERLYDEFDEFYEEERKEEVRSPKSLVDSSVEDLDSEDDEDDDNEFPMAGPLYYFGSRVSNRQGSIDLSIEGMQDNPISDWIKSQHVDSPLVSPPPRALDSEGKELREIPKDVFETVKTALENHTEEMSPRSFAEARAQIYQFSSDTQSEIISLKSSIPLALADPWRTRFDSDSEEARFLTCLFNVTTKQGVADIKKALDTEDMWYRLQLALIKTAYEVEQEKQVSMADKSELLQSLLMRKQDREYPDVFYISESSHTLKSRSWFLSEIQTATSSFMEDDPYVFNENFRQKLIGNIDRSPHEMTYNFYSK